MYPSLCCSILIHLRATTVRSGHCVQLTPTTNCNARCQTHDTMARHQLTHVLRGGGGARRESPYATVLHCSTINVRLADESWLIKSSSNET